MKKFKLLKSVIERLYKASFIFVTLQGIIIFLFLYDNRGRIGFQLAKYDLLEILSRNSSLDTIYLKDYIYYFQDILNSLSKPQLDRLDLSVNFNDFKLLECSRLDKENCTKDGWIRGPKLIHNNETYKIKLRAKGDREIHRQNIKKMSFKVDIRGDKRMFGMEEFSLQLPVIRNYSMESLVANLLRKENILSPRNRYVKLFMNGEYLGIRHLEEGFGRELVENGKRRYGPVFSLDEDSGEPFITNRFDLNDRKNWFKSENNLSHSALSVLRLVQSEPEKVNEYFDIDKWAKYFAMLDSFHMIHGTLPKSVKFYLNPVNGKFEPIFYDGHYGTGLFDKFLLTDFIRPNDSPKNCRYACNESAFYKMFFGDIYDINEEFLNKYISNLKYFSSEKYFNEKFNREWNTFSRIRGNFYREFLKRDQAHHEGLMPHVAPKTRIYEKLKNIQNDIKVAENKNPYHAFDFSNNELLITNKSSRIPQKYNIYCEKESPLLENFIIKDVPMYLNIKEIDKSCSFQNIKFSINEGNKKQLLKDSMVSDYELDIKLKNNSFPKSFSKEIVGNEMNNILFKPGKTFIKNNKTIINKKIIFGDKSEICFKNNSILFIKDSELTIKGSFNNPVIFKGCEGETGSLVIDNSNINLGFFHGKNLNFPEIKLRSLYGGINILNSNLIGESISILNSNSEDAINFVNSGVKLNTINIENAMSDAIDSDNSFLDIKQIFCKSIGNDCLDLSFSEGKVNSLKAISVEDKVLSLGEKSTLKINNLSALKSEMGIVNKDQSNLFLDKYSFQNVKIPISSYIKKNEFNSPKLTINFLENELDNDFLKFISKDSLVIIEKKRYFGLSESNKISDLLYGNLYGVKTKR